MLFWQNNFLPWSKDIQMPYIFFKKIPPYISVPAFYIFIFVTMILRFLFSSTFGALVLAIWLYIYVGAYTLTDPLKPMELIWWLVELPVDYKVALISSIVTVGGFVIAFHIATQNWKDQLKAKLKAEAAREIELFFTGVCRNITVATIYVESLVEAVDEINKVGITADTDFSVRYALEKTYKFLAARDALSEASIEVHRLISKNHSLLSTGFGVPANAKCAAEALMEIREVMWIHVPIVDMKSQNYIKSFVDQINLAEYKNFLKVCKINYGKISGLSGGIQGYLTAPIWGFSFTMLANLLFSKKEFREAIEELHKDFNGNRN